jgi:hypothetical protein
MLEFPRCNFIMVPMPRILLFGRSLFIASLQASLETVPGLETQNVEANLDRLQERLIDWKPDVLIFEMTGIDQIPSVAMLRKFPNLLLIGVDREINELFVLSGHHQQAFSSTDLVKVIHQERPSPSTLLPQDWRSPHE